MSMRQALLPEFDHEMATTRRVLERVPDDRLSWQPHPRSMTMGRLASHVAELPGWANSILEDDEFDFAPPEGPAPKAANLPSRQEILDLFDANVAKTRARLEQAEDDRMLQPWTLRKGEQVIFSMPRAVTWRSFVMSHLIHHRGQLSVYLRLNDQPVPSIYGPSADEGSM